MNKPTWLATVAVILMVASASEATAASIVNFSFEQPTTPSFVYDPFDPTGGWTFDGRSGVAANTFFTPPPPNGTQAAFIQQYVDQPSSLSAISQLLSGVALAPATLSFYIAQRPGYTANPIVVSYGAQNLGTFTPASTAFTLVTISFTPSAASGVLSFRSASATTGDIDSALDAVTFNQAGQPVPEPTTLALMGAGSGLLALRRRRSQRGKRATC